MDQDEQAGGGARAAVQGGGGRLLAGAGLADDQGRGVGRGGVADRRIYWDAV